MIPDPGDDREGLPEVLYVKDFAALLRISPAALRRRAARGQVPRPFRSGRTLAWTRGSVLSWLRDCGRSAEPADMKITLRPYSHDTSRWHVDIRLMNPCNPDTEIRKRKVAPAGMSEAQARAWGERQVPKILRKVLGSEAARDEKEATHDRNPYTKRHTTPRSHGPRRGEMTLGELYIHRFEPEYVQLQKPATRVAYGSIFRNHIGPHLGDVPLVAIDEDRLSVFRATVAAKLKPSTVNLVLAKVAKILRFAKRVRQIEAMPDVEKMRAPKPRPKAVYSEVQITALLEAARSIDPQCEIVCLLALDAGLRTSEICALRWGDVDLDAGTIVVQHNDFRGETLTPKGGIGRLAMTSVLRQALVEHRKREPIGPLVLYRRSHWTAGEWRPHTPHSVRYQLNLAQRAAGIADSGLHLLRHTALTRLANLGASVYVVQAVARHSRLQTTQAYIHTQQGGLAREAAELLDRAANDVAGKSLAKRAKTRKK